MKPFEGLIQIPPFGWLLIHVLTDAKRVSTYGLRIRPRFWKDDWSSILTHTFIHHSGDHVLNNLMAWVGVVMTADTWEQKMALTWPEVALRLAAMYVGGTIGGVGGLLLARKMFPATWAQKVTQRFLIVCGSSACVQCYGAFTAFSSGHFFRGALYLVPETLMLMDRVRLTQQLSAWSSFARAWEPTIGHEAHLGGGLMGAALGALLYIVRRRWRGNRRTAHRSGEGRRLGSAAEPPPDALHIFWVIVCCVLGI